MGSSCSILNDTEHDVWVTHEVDWEVLIGVTRGLVNVFALGARMLALVADEEEGGRRSCHEVATGAVTRGVATGAVTQEKKAGLTKKDWVQVASVLEMSDGALAELLSISQNEDEKMKSAVQEFQEKAELIKPGEKYTWSGTLSLTMRVYVMNDKLQVDDKGCFTGSTAGSENVYTISNHFKKLDVY